MLIQACGSGNFEKNACDGAFDITSQDHKLITVGMSKDALVNLMGEPTSIYTTDDPNISDYRYYVTVDGQYCGQYQLYVGTTVGEVNIYLKQ